MSIIALVSVFFLKKKKTKSYFLWEEDIVILKYFSLKKKKNLSFRFEATVDMIAYNGKVEGHKSHENGWSIDHSEFPL